MPKPASPSPTAPLWVVGAANVDVAGRSHAALRSGDSNPGTVNRSAGGVGRNIAENLARLGHPVRLLAAIADDEDGRWLRTRTRGAGVDLRALKPAAGVATSRYLALHGADGRLLGAVNDMAAIEAVTPARLRPCARALRQASALVLDANLDDAAIGWLCGLDTPALRCADAVSAAKAPRLRPWLGRLVLLKANLAEAEAISGLPLTTPGQCERAADWFHAHGVRRFALSLGDRGLLLSEGGQRLRQPAWPVAMVSANGAGDALMAGLVHGQLAGWSLRRCAAFAVGCAALTLSVAEANHPGLDAAAVQRLRRRVRLTMRA